MAIFPSARPIVQLTVGILLIGTAEAAPPARFLVPAHAFSVHFDQEIESLVQEYNRLNPEAKVELIRKGRGYSALREFMVGFFAGAPAAMSLVEPAELAALERSGALAEIPAARRKKLLKGIRSRYAEESRSPSGKLVSLPFFRFAPVLAADQEIFFRHHLDPESLPESWAGLLERARGIQEGAGSTKRVFALPLHGERGLWLFETLTGSRLWEEGPSLAAAGVTKRLLSAFRSDAPGLRADVTDETAVEDFIERRAALLATGSDVLPYIASRAPFRWKAAPLPALKTKTPLPLSGSQILISKKGVEHPAVWRFLEFLYQPATAARWTITSGSLPLNPEWVSSPAWRKVEQRVFGRHSTYTELVKSVSATRARPDHPDVVRRRSLWSKALTRIFAPETPPAAVTKYLKDLDKSFK